MGRVAKSETDLGRRLLAIRGQRSRSEFATLLGVHENTLGGYERGSRQPDWDFLVKLTEKAGVNLNWLVTGGNTPDAPKEPSLRFMVQPVAADEANLPDGWSSVRVFDIEAAAGSGRINPEHEIDASLSLAVEERWLYSRFRINSKRLAGVYVKGDSMSPSFREGDIVLVDIGSDRIVGEGVYVLVSEQGMMLKRVSLMAAGGVVLRSDNPSYGDQTIPNDHVGYLRVYGRVVAAFSQV